jgi:transposase
MEACLSARFVCRALRQLGHQPRIIPAIYVKPFLKGQTTTTPRQLQRPPCGRICALFVKTQDQLDLQALHRCSISPVLATDGDDQSDSCLPD